MTLPRFYAALQLLGQHASYEDMVGFAQHLVDQGRCSPPTAALILHHWGDLYFPAEVYFDSLLRELGAPALSQSDAVWVMLRFYVRSLIERDRPPFEILRDIWENLEVLHYLDKSHGMEALLRCYRQYVDEMYIEELESSWDRRLDPQAIELARVWHRAHTEPIRAEWKSSTVLDLARAMETDGAFDRLPILADALEDAGCDQADILEHCRGPGPHVRGCWVVDLILGKS